jgi:hypothetical protein
MGMFDSLYVEVKLPIPSPVDKLKINWKKEEFQTKGLDNLMHKYRINRAGQLVFLDQETEWVEDDSPSRFGGYLNVISERWIKSNYTGKVVFYTTVCSNPEQKENSFFELVPEDQIDSADGFDYSLDFEAKFVDGKLKDLKFLRVDVYPIKEYLINHNKWAQEVKEKQSKLSYKIKSFFKKVIPNKGYYKIINKLNKFVGLQQKLITKLY